MRKLKNFALSIMSFIFFIAVGLLVITEVNTNKAVYAETLGFVEYKETYNIGETVAIQPAEFDYKGEKYQANICVRLPNGLLKKYDEIVLSEPGIYYIEYSAVADDNTLLKEIKSFTVLANVYTFEGEGEYEYGSNSYLKDDVKGLNVSLGRNSTLKINTPININNLTKEDSIFKFYVTPDAKGKAEVEAVFVRLTDVHDESKYVELQYRPVGNFQYVFASANGQLLTGLSQSNNPTQSTIEYDNYYFTLAHSTVKNGAGHVSRASLTGVIDNNNANYLKNTYFSNNENYTEQEMFFYNSLEIRMDYAQKRVYSQPDGQYGILRCICADFDDERTLGGKAPWEGFTSGEVFISVYAENYTATSFNFFITDVYGQDVSKSTMKNELAPRLSVDTQEYDVNNLPNAIVGKKYNLFDAFASDDVDGEVAVSVKVYNSIGATLSVVDNSFTPTQEGTYTIEYSATDSFGNKSTRTLKVKAIKRDSIDYELSDGIVQGRTGEVVSVKALTLFNPSNFYELKIYAKNSAQNVEYLIDNEDLSFVPLFEGTYTITYLYSDYCVEQEISYDIVVNSSDLVFFDTDIVLPKYVIKGLDYPVQKLYGYTFVNGTERKLAQFYIKEENKEERSIEGDCYSVQNNVAFVDLIYKIDGKECVYRRPVIDAVSIDSLGYKVDLAKYFYNSIGSFASQAESNRIEFEVLSAVDNRARLEVINPARLINDFNIGFYTEQGKTNFTGIKVIFESAYDSNKTVEFKFEREIGTAAKVFVSAKNFSVEGDVTSKFTTPVVASDNFNITYYSTTKEFDISGFAVDATMLLDDFDDLFYISFELYGINGDSAINITKVVNQKITNDEYDGVKPTVLFSKFKSYYVVGDELKLGKIQVYDFVDPNPTCVVTLQTSSGYLISTDGVKLDGKENDINNQYVVKVETINRMNFKISSEDFSGNSYPINLPLMVKDVVAPSIELDVKDTVYKVGAEVTIADCIIADESTAQSDLKVTSYLIAPDGSIKYLSSKSFKADKAGTYSIYYIVRDEAGNNAYANYLILVK